MPGNMCNSVTLNETVRKHPLLGRQTKKEPPWREWERLSYRNGLRHAIFSFKSDKYVGEWKCSLKEGKGRITDRHGWIFEGDWMEGLRHGHGVLSKIQKNYCVKTYYIGDWHQGKKHGYGRQIYEDGNVYMGEWSEGKRSGHGRMWYNNGDFYEGDWLNDKPHGYGIFIYANGCRYEGEWCNGLKHGHGRFYHLRTGQVQDGLWIEGICQCSEVTDIRYRQNASHPTPYPMHKNEIR